MEPIRCICIVELPIDCPNLSRSELLYPNVPQTGACRFGGSNIFLLPDRQMTGTTLFKMVRLACGMISGSVQVLVSLPGQVEVWVIGLDVSGEDDL